MPDQSSATFDPRNPPRRAITVDIVLFTVFDGSLWVVMNRRPESGDEPFPGHLSLPGTFVGDQEELLGTAQRVLRDKVGISLDAEHLSRSGVYDRPDRDPRMRTISVAFTVFIAEHERQDFIERALQEGTLHRVDALLTDGTERLAFDHRLILEEAREHAGELLEETNAALDLLPPVFTIPQLREVYEAVWSTRLDPGNFIRRVTRIEGFIEQLPSGALRAPDMAGAPEDADLLWVTYESLPPSLPPSPPESAAESLSPVRPPSKSRSSSPSRPPSSPPRGRPPRQFVGGGTEKLHPSLRRPGSYFSRPSAPDVPDD